MLRDDGKGQGQGRLSCQAGESRPAAPELFSSLIPSVLAAFQAEINIYV